MSISFPDYCQWPVTKNCLGCDVHVPHNTCTFRPKEIDVDALMEALGIEVIDISRVICIECDRKHQLDNDCYVTCKTFLKELERIEFDNPITHKPPASRPDKIMDIISPEEVQQMEEGTK